jgi:hypothetical protein
LNHRWIAVLIALLLSVMSVIACNFPVSTNQTLTTLSTSTLEVAASEPTQATVFEVPTLVPTVIVAIPTIAPSPTIYIPPPIPSPSFVEPSGCQRPPDDYTRVVVNGSILNYRTLAMLKHAQDLYGGTIDFAGWAITQGSYNPGKITASFGTHDGGGAVDIAVRSPRTGAILTNELDAAIRSLRIAGFAAWVREVGELYPNSPIHIHAIAVGDAELSPDASEQLTGKYGYFRGYNGLPQTDNIPITDRYGGPIFCQWMLDMGFMDLRNGAATQ